MSPSDRCQDRTIGQLPSDPGERKAPSTRLGRSRSLGARGETVVSILRPQWALRVNQLDW
jgi:hypothetical protein